MPFNDRWVAEYGEWVHNGLSACESIAFLVARDEDDAKAITEQLNTLQMSPPQALGVVGRVKDGVGWLGPAGEGQWEVGWQGSIDNWERLMTEDAPHDPDPMPVPGKDVYQLTGEEREAKAQWYERRGNDGIAAIIRNPWDDED